MSRSSKPSNRADEIRRRRSNQTHKVKVATSASKPKQAISGNRRTLLPARKSRSVGTPEPPPVMVRGSARSAATPRSRRLYNVSLGTTGAEMRLPSIPRVRVGWRVISFLLAGLLAYSLYQVWNSPQFHVKTVQISGLQRLDSNAVLEVVNIGDQPIFMIDPKRIEQSLLVAFAEFSEVAVAIQPPDTVLVRVTERIPALIWKLDGRAYLVDNQGTIFSLRDEDVQMSYPVVEATASPPLPYWAAQELLKETEQALDTAGLFESLGLVSVEDLVKPEPARPFMTPEMVRVVLMMSEKLPEGAVLIYNAENGLGWQDRRGWNVYFGGIGQQDLAGATSEFEMKLQVYQAILEHLKAQDTKPALISVEYLHAPYYRLAP
jgi:cell division protein FtsQ